jgi:hypothetical protein
MSFFQLYYIVCLTRKKGESRLQLWLGGFVSKVVIPVKTGIQIDIIRHEFWIPTCVGMTKKLKNGTYNTSLAGRED